MKVHGDAIESDLLRYYQIDLPAALGTNRLTWRRLRVLLGHLPRESAFVQADRGQSARWGELEHLVASVIDVLQAGNYLTTRAHFQGKPKPPTPIRRPGDPQGRGHIGRRKYTPEQMRQKLDHWGEGMVAVGAREVT